MYILLIWSDMSSKKMQLILCPRQSKQRDTASIFKEHRFVNFRHLGPSSGELLHILASLIADEPLCELGIIWPLGSMSSIGGLPC